MADTAALDTSKLDVVLSTVQVRPLGPPILTDDFQNPAEGPLLRTSPDPDHIKVEVGVASIAWSTSIRRGTSRPSSGSVCSWPMRVSLSTCASTPRRPGPYIGCRRSTTEFSGCRLLVDIPRQRAALQRLDNGRSIELARRTAMSEIKPATDINHLELRWGLSAISASINGVEVGTVDDDQYRGGGHLWLGTSNYPDIMIVADARFSNLVVTQE